LEGVQASSVCAGFRLACAAQAASKVRFWSRRLYAAVELVLYIDRGDLLDLSYAFNRYDEDVDNRLAILLVDL
jgi:hypothetical protein